MGRRALLVTAVRCSFTVRSWIPRSAAICLFNWPPRTCCKTSRSRSLSTVKARAQSTNSLAFGALAGYRDARARLTASSNASRGASLVRKSSAPRRMARTESGISPVTGEEDNRKRIGHPGERLLQFRAVHAGHLQVGNHAAGGVHRKLGEELGRRTKTP